MTLRKKIYFYVFFVSLQGVESQLHSLGDKVELVSHDQPVHHRDPAAPRRALTQRNFLGVDPQPDRVLPSRGRHESDDLSAFTPKADEELADIDKEKVGDSLDLKDLPEDYSSGDVKKEKVAQEKMKQAKKRILAKVMKLTEEQASFAKEIADMDWLPRDLKKPLAKQVHELQRLIDLSKELVSAKGYDITQVQNRVEEQLRVVQEGFDKIDLRKYKDFTSLQRLATSLGLDVSGNESVHLVDHTGKRALEQLADQEDIVNPYDDDQMEMHLDFSRVNQQDGPPINPVRNSEVNSVKPVGQGDHFEQEESELKVTGSWLRAVKWAVTGLTVAVTAYHVAKVVTAKPEDISKPLVDHVVSKTAQGDSYRWSMFLGK